jgi:hypothetical protein
MQREEHQSKMKSRTGHKNQMAQASEAALDKAKRSVDVEYQQGQAREIRRSGRP